MNKRCGLCGKDFRTWRQHQEHQKQKHGITDEMGVPRLHFPLDIPRVYVPMDPVQKQRIVEETESAIRTEAWLVGKLNPLIGLDKVTVEPIWDTNRNIVGQIESGG